MKRYRLISNQRENDVTVLTMRPKTPSARMEFRAGQYVAIGFKRRGRRSPMRCFSLTNAPNSAGELQIAFRQQGDFTHALAELERDEELFISGPFGSFYVPAGQEYPLVYLAAGIGITPFLSMLRAQAQRVNKIPTTLLYSCRSLNDIPFAEDLIQLARENPWFTLRFLVNQLPGSFRPHPLVLAERLTPEVLRQFGHEDADYYICGPTGYTKHACRMLEKDGIMDDQINCEAFGQGAKLGADGFALHKTVYSMVAVALVVGFGGVFSMDAVRAHARAAHTAALSPVQSAPLSSSQAPSSNDSGSSYSYSAPATNSAPAPTPAPVSQNNYYQPPVSSVS